MLTLPPPPLPQYFSTLERLRLAQTSVLNASSQHRYTKSNHTGGDLGAVHNPRVHPYWGFNRVVSGKKHLRPTTSPADQSHLVPADTLALAKLPAKIREKHLTREEQLLLAKQLRESVILDAADEAIYRLGRRFNPQVFSPTLPSSSESGFERSEMDMDMHTTRTSQDDLYDCFRWLDEDDDLDLSLVLDDDSLKHPDNELPIHRHERRPSFRRHLSISKITFGNRLSVDSSRPATNHVVPSPTSPALSGFSSQAQRRSRAFSLMTPRYASRDSIASIDPAAAHYQDPEARLKLRVYLSSPQKFDEAIEFGFPSNDPFPADSEQEHPRPVKRRSHQVLQDETENMRTFLSDDHSSVCSEDMSISDPESPKTPQTFDQPPLRPMPRSSRDDGQANVSEGYAQAPVASREMTLRMTLTRPDLRACEDQIYGWTNSYQPSSRLPRSSPFRDDSPATYVGARPKESMDRIFADIDQDIDAQSSQGGVMKRLWKRVKRSQ